MSMDAQENDAWMRFVPLIVASKLIVKENPAHEAYAPDLIVHMDIQFVKKLLLKLQHARNAHILHIQDMLQILIIP